MTELLGRQARQAGEALPAWRLDDLYPGPESSALTDDLQTAEEEARAFEARHKGALATLSGAELGAAIARYEAIDERLMRLMSYAHLTYAGDVGDAEIGRFFQGVQEKVNVIASRLLFFILELNEIDDAALEAGFSDPVLAGYAPWLRDIRVMRPYQLSEEIERLLHEKSVAGQAAWTRLFDETIAALTFPVGGKDLGSAEILHLLSDPDGAVRREAAETLGRVLGENIRTFAFITNTLAKDREIENRWRGFKRPVSARNLANLVEDEVVDALVAAVKEAYPSLSHRYYRIKARWCGGEVLDYWDRNAPLPEEPDRVISWPEAREIVLGAYARFSPEMAEIGARFFDERWIDAQIRPGKAPGAFSHATVPSAHPYILLNYQGRVRDVMTLAHELGHGIHQVLAAGQGHLMADTPLTLAETASVFGEMLTFRAMLDAEDDPRNRRAMLAGKVEDMLNTGVRQIAFYEFERQVHDARKEGELSHERLGEIWLAVQTESLGPAIRFDAAYSAYWSYIPHFIHAPFYVYAYAFGDGLVNALYAVYGDAEAGFAGKYLAMLRAGGSKRHKALLAPFGLDASDPGFWKRGLVLLESFIDELDEKG